MFVPEYMEILHSPGVNIYWFLNSIFISMFECLHDIGVQPLGVIHGGMLKKGL